MRNITFQEVGMENYGPYITPMVLSFKDNNLVLITGPNGIGKTMALDAIPFTLYGITSKGAKPDDVVNNTVGKNCKTWVKLKINDDDFEVTRFHKHSKGGSTVYLRKNGVDIKKGQREVLTEVERIICPRKMFMNTLMFGQKVKDFFTDLGDSDKKEIFRRILDLDAYSQYYDIAKKMLDQLQISRGEIDKKIAVINGILVETKNQINILLKQKEEFENNKNNKIQQIKKSIEDNTRLFDAWNLTLNELKEQLIDITKLELEIRSLQEKINEIEKHEQKCLLELQAKKNEKIYEIKSKLTENIQKAKDEERKQIDEIQEQINLIKEDAMEFDKKQLEKDKSIRIKEAQINANKRNKNDLIEEIKVNVLNANIASCPLCKQDITDTTKKELERRITTLLSELENLENEKKVLYSLEKELENASKQKSEETQAKLLELVKRKEAITKKFTSESNELNDKLKSTIILVDDSAKEQEEIIKGQCKIDLEKYRVDLNNLKIIKEKQDSIKKKFDETEKTIVNIQNQNKIFENEINNIEKQEFDMRQMKSYEGKIIELENQLSQGANALKELSKMQDVIEFWKSGFSSTGIPSMLIDEAIPFMNQKVTQYLDLITNGRYIVSFDTMAETKSGEFRDKISVRVIDTYTRANSRVQLSGGQTRIIDIATILTLGDLQSTIQNVRFNILLFDEIFDSLDDENIGYVSKVLGKLKENRSIYIISHTHQEQVEADEVLAFR